MKSIKIGTNSFTKKKNSNGDDTSRSFHLLNCAELKSIEIGLFSFSDYSGGFELFNLPKLSTIKIGEIGNDSSNFYYSSFVVKGIVDRILIMNRSSIIKFYWIRWLYILWILINNNIKYFNESNNNNVDLPHLNSIKLGTRALAGKDNESCSLKMESNIDWINW